MTRYYIDLVDIYGNIIETEEEVFDNREDAEYYAMECDANFAEGAEILELANRPHLDPEYYHHEVREED